MGCTRRLQEKLSVHIEEFISPLTVIARAIKSTYQSRNEISNGIKSFIQGVYDLGIVQHFYQGASQVARLPEVVTTIKQGQETQLVVKESLKSNLLVTLLPMIAMETMVKPLQQYYLPNAGMPFIWYFNFLIMRENLRRLFLYAPLNNVCISQALNKDLELAFTQDVTHFLKKEYAKDLKKFFVKEDVPFEVKVFNEKISQLICEELAKEFVKVIVPAFSESSIIEKAYADKNKSPDLQLVYFHAMAEKLAKQFTATNIDNIVSQALKRLFNSLNLKNKVDSGLIAKEAEIRAFFQKNTSSLMKIISKLSVYDFTNHLCQYILTKKSKANKFLALLPSQHFYARQHSTTEMIYTRLMDPFYYLFSIRTQFVLSAFHPWMGRAFEAFLTGFLLLDLKFSSVGMPRDQRFEIVSRNIPYLFGLGAAVLALTDLSSHALSYIPGGNRWYVPLAVYYPIYQLFSLSMLLNNDPLPGQSIGIDLFRLHRAEADNGISMLANYFFPKFKDPAFRAKLLGYFNHPVILFARLLFTGGKLKSVEELVKRPVFNTLLKLYGRDLLDGLKQVEDMQSSRILPLAKMVLSLFSGIVVSPHVPGLITFIQDKNVNEVVQQLKILVDLAERHRNGGQALAAESKEGFFDFAKELRDWQERDKKAKDQKLLTAPTEESSLKQDFYNKQLQASVSEKKESIPVSAIEDKKNDEVSRENIVVRSEPVGLLPRKPDLQEVKVSLTPDFSSAIADVLDSPNNLDKYGFFAANQSAALRERQVSKLEQRCKL